jgi:hypothetical protein
MSIKLIKTVNFGSGKGSLTTVGYRLLDSAGTLSGSRVTAGIGEVLSAAGIYSASVYFSTAFSGSILWDTGEGTPTYATEDYNGIEENVDYTRHIQAGRWLIHTGTYEMIFYREDNETEIARYSLKDRSGAPNFEEVFERVKK